MTTINNYKAVLDFIILNYLTICISNNSNNTFSRI